MTRLATMIIIFIPIILFSFEHPKQQNPAFIFCDKVNVRELPNSKSKVITQLPIGARIDILSKTDKIDEIDGLVDYWYKITVNNKIGYIWGGLISNYYIFINQNVQNLLLMIRNFSEHSYANHIDLEKFKNRKYPLDFECKILKNNKPLYGLKDLGIIGEYNIKSMTYNKYDGFSEPVYLLRIMYDNKSELSELGSGEMYFYINDNHIYLVLEAWSGSEGGGGNKFRIIFPNNRNGEPNKIIIENTYLGYEHPGEIKITSVNKEKYIWNKTNKRFIKIK